MIVTSAKPYGVIKAQLKKWKKIGIVACNSCARLCETGGKQKMEEMAERLKQDGYNIVDVQLVPMACAIDVVEKPNYEADMLLSMACDSGLATLRLLFPTKDVVPTNDTIGIGARDGQGNIFIMKKI
jgi:hypothetical protein